MIPVFATRRAREALQPSGGHWHSTERYCAITKVTQITNCQSADTAITNVAQITNWQSVDTAITNVAQISNWQSVERTTPNGQARTERTRRVRHPRTL